jgi:multidrug efflux pump subunit AcrA (membrane-fusion protein)
MNFKNKILPAVAILGLAIAVIVAIQGERKTPPAQPVAQPAQAPFKSYIGGAGLVEASSNNINIGTGLAGIVKTIFVKVGQTVAAGTPLFEIDDRERQAELQLKEANLAKARAAVVEAKATLEDASSQYALVRDVVGNERAVSLDDVQKRRNAELLAKAKLESARAAVTASHADIRSTQSNLDRLIVRAPINGQIMQVNIRPGEFAQAGVLTTPLIMMGNLDLLYVRVNIDENDAWRFTPQTSAVASMRGNREMKTGLTFVRVEPYVTPKQSLTGASTERVDTRVLQVLYSFKQSALPAYVGQQMDVFIETPEIPTIVQPAVAGNGERK